MRLPYSLLLAGSMFVYFPPATSNAEEILDRIIAVVNDDVIMQSEVIHKLRILKAQSVQQKQNLPPDNILAKQILENLILIKLQLQLAENTGIVVDDETLNQTINKVAEQNKLTLTQFRDILEQDGYSYERFREDIKGEITISRLKQRHVDNRISVSNNEIDNYLATEKLQGGLAIENEYRLSHILIAIPEEATAEDREHIRISAEKVLLDISNGEDFADLAMSLSDGQQAEQGGDLGWRKTSEIPTLFADRVAQMKEGETSELIESPGGFHIIKLTGLRNSEIHMVTQTEARHILMRPNELLTDNEIKNKLNVLKTRIIGGDDFGALAKSHSDDTASAINGGDLGWTNPGTMVPEFEAVMQNLQPGEISDPFKTQFGWHIVQVLDRREYNNSVDILRDKAREIIRERKIVDAQQNWLRQLRDEAYVEYRLDER